MRSTPKAARRCATRRSPPWRSAPPTRLARWCCCSATASTPPALSEDQVLEIARRSDAIVYTIGIRMRRCAGSAFPLRRRRSITVFPGARVAGDRRPPVLYAEQNRDIERTFARALDEFNTRYVLGYAPRGVAGAGWAPSRGAAEKEKRCWCWRAGYFAE